MFFGQLGFVFAVQEYILESCTILKNYLFDKIQILSGTNISQSSKGVFTLWRVSNGDWKGINNVIAYLILNSVHAHINICLLTWLQLEDQDCLTKLPFGLVQCDFASWWIKSFGCHRKSLFRKWCWNGQQQWLSGSRRQCLLVPEGIGTCLHQDTHLVLEPKSKWLFSKVKK